MTATLPADAASLAQVIQDCQNWLSETLSTLFYADAADLPASSLPKLYSQWSQAPRTMSAFRQRDLYALKSKAEKMNSALQDAKSNQPPHVSEFQKFMAAYEDFAASLNDVQSEFLLNSHGLDVQTGFKTSLLVYPEMKREFERRGRQGNPFSVIMLRVDASEVEKENEVKMHQMASAINKCLRGFDDVYRMNESDILVSLKLADIKGGLRFVERLKAELKSLNAQFTFSSCVAEPDPSNDLNKFIQELESDLADVAAHGGGQTVKFEEVSPMQRFIATMKDRR